MVLVEFELGRQKVIEEVDRYLQVTFEIKSYKDIFPALLLQKSPDEPHMGVYPLVGVEHVQNPNSYWEARVPGSPGRKMFGVTRIQDRGFYLRAIGNFDQSEWTVKRPRSYSFAGGVFHRPVREIRRLVKRPVHFLGVVEDLFSNEEREVYVIDFDPHYGVGYMNRFMAAKWLKDSTTTKGFFWSGSHSRPLSELIPTPRDLSTE